MFNFFIETKGHTILSIQVYKCIQKEINLLLGLMWDFGWMELDDVYS